MTGEGVTNDLATLDPIGHAQRNSQVRIGPKIVIDDACGALCCEDHVDPQRSAPLGNIDDSIDEFRHILHQGSKLIDHNDERWRSCWVPSPLERNQILRLMVRKQALTVGQLGPQTE